MRCSVRPVPGDEDRSRGFTLIELLVVVVIISILIAIAIPLYLNYKKGANDKAAQADLRSAINVLEQCNSNNAGYPSALGTASGNTYPAMTGCTGQTINFSSGTTLTYYPKSSTDLSAYIMSAKNSGGTGNTYCYSSATGGSVATTGTAVTAYRAAC